MRRTSGHAMKVPKCSPTKRVAGCAGDDDLELLVEAIQRREAATAVPPVRVLAQLLDARVVVGERGEEGRRIAGVDRRPAAQLAGGRPQALQAQIADGEPAPADVAQPQPEVLPDLDPDDAVLGRDAQVALQRALAAAAPRPRRSRGRGSAAARLEVAPRSRLDVGRRPAGSGSPTDGSPPSARRPVARRAARSRVECVVVAMGVDDLAAIARVLADHFDSAAAFCR